MSLCDAAARGDVQACINKLDHGAKVDAIGKNSATPLIRAAAKGHTEVVALLLARGANCDHAAHTTGVTALVIAADRGKSPSRWRRQHPPATPQQCLPAAPHRASRAR